MMGRWLTGLESKYSDSLGQGTAKTAKTTVRGGHKFPDHLKKVTDKTPVSRFCQLVRHYGADRQRLLSYEEIMVELDADDLKELEQTDRRDRQIWAEMLADRLTRRVK
jgi:hypothetical protein